MDYMLPRGKNAGEAPSHFSNSTVWSPRAYHSDDSPNVQNFVSYSSGEAIIVNIRMGNKFLNKRRRWLQLQLYLPANNGELNIERYLTSISTT